MINCVLYFYFLIKWLALAEILSVKHMPDGQTQYYVHYIDYNKRLDEWVDKGKLCLLHKQTNKPNTQWDLIEIIALSSIRRSLYGKRSPGFKRNTVA